jgi:4-amino-4-deoxy-L-arabinose transferase-like glycosyltransferase
LSLIGCGLVGSLVAAQLGANRIGQALGAFVVLTLPMAILQASSAQDHLVVSFWLLCLASLALAARERVGWRLTIEVGVCLGLAIITKVTTYVFAPPLLLLAGYWLIRWTRWRALPHLALAGLIAASLGSLQWARNLAVFGWPLGPRGETATYVVSSFGPVTFAERIIQEFSIQLVVPTHALNGWITGALTGLAGLLHLDLNNPATTYLGYAWSVRFFNTHEDFTANLLALLVIILVAAVVVVRQRGYRLAYLLAVAAGFALFAGYLRWQPWNARLQLPLFVLAAPLAGVVVAEWRRSLTLALAAVLLVGSLPWLVAASERPLLGPGSVLTTSRIDQYFANGPELEDPYVQTAAAIRGSNCRDVGLAVKIEEHSEYPLWRLLNPGDQEVMLRDIEVSNDTASLETGPPPCMIVSIQDAPTATQTYRGVAYGLVLSVAPLFLYQRQDP